MTNLLQYIQRLLLRDLEAMALEINSFPSDEMIWTAPVGISNPAGTLALHVCGNLRHYVGHVLGGTDYVRDRVSEFSDRSSTREKIIGEISSTSVTLRSVLPSMDESKLSSTYPEPIAGVELNTLQFLLHLCTHLAYHVGQAGYLRRVLTRDDRSIGPVSVKALAEDG